jgi:hypothetical protein
LFFIWKNSKLLPCFQGRFGGVKKRWPDRKAGRVYGGNDGLAFAMRGARKRRKNRQGGQKLFSVLIFGYFPSREIAIAIMNTY